MTKCDAFIFAGVGGAEGAANGCVSALTVASGTAVAGEVVDAGAGATVAVVDLAVGGAVSLKSLNASKSFLSLTTTHRS